jgi:hypothetical protein
MCHKRKKPDGLTFLTELFVSPAIYRLPGSFCCVIISKSPASLLALVRTRIPEHPQVTNLIER